MENFKIYAVYEAPMSTKELNDIKSKMSDQSIAISYNLFAEMLVKCLKNSDFINSEYGLFVYELSSERDFEVLVKDYAKPSEAYKYDGQFNQELRSYCVAIDLVDQIKKSLIDLYSKTANYSETVFDDINYKKTYNSSNLDFVRDHIDEDFDKIINKFEETASIYSII
jgi:hypothetical protein